eukprot:TRINITY_DN89565_c0_g1_i1.p1 TRINITY_DN89565_c0_g1~~TRINITY_DN89565_c0_g1_i1.p1  ORF type:complete len:392 (+),score=80.23 TRINITY_DN89565_c0_g1_i1:39-1214(+)
MANAEDELRRLRAVAVESARKIAASREPVVPECGPLARAPSPDNFAHLPPPPPSRRKRLRSDAGGDVRAIADDMASRHQASSFGAAKAAADAAVAASEGGENTFQEGSPYTILEVPDSYVPMLIGPHGKTIKQIQEETGAAICVGKIVTEGIRKVCVTGQPEHQLRAAESVRTLLSRMDEHLRDRREIISETMEVPEKYLPRLIGKHGVNIKRIKEAAGVKIQSPQQGRGNDEPKLLTLQGSSEGVAQARELVEKFLLECYRKDDVFNAPLEQKYNAGIPVLQDMPLGIETQTAVKKSDFGLQLDAFAADGSSTSRVTSQAYGACIVKPSSAQMFCIPEEGELCAKDESMEEALLQTWAMHFAGSSVCVSLFKHLMIGDEELTPVPGFADG